MKKYSSPDGSSPILTIVEVLAFSLLGETFLFALYLVLMIYLICRPYATRKARSLPLFLKLFTLSMFFLYSAYWALDVNSLWQGYSALRKEGFGRKTPFENAHLKGVPSIVKEELSSQVVTTIYVQYIVQLILVILGDCVSLWRAYVIFERPKWLYILLGCIIAAESVSYVLIFISSSMAYLSYSVPGSVDVLAEARAPITFIGYSITALAQLTSTSLIAYKAREYWVDVRGSLYQSISRPSRSALAVIIESGIAYLFLLVWYGAISFFGSFDSTVVFTCRFYCVPLIAMYPTLVIIIVTSRRSMLERYYPAETHIDTCHDPPITTHSAYASPYNRHTGECGTHWIYLSFVRDPERMSDVPASSRNSRSPGLYHTSESLSPRVKPHRGLLDQSAVALPTFPSSTYF